MTPTTDHILIEAIRTNPEDDLTRLAYADWLEGEGNTNVAEVIRNEITNTTSYKLEWDGWWGIPIETMSTHSLSTVLDWLTWVTSCLPHMTGFVVGIHKGFITYIECKQEWWLTYSMKPVRYQPVAVVRLKDKSAQWSSTLPRCFFQEEKSKYNPSSYYASQDYPCIIHKDIYQYLGLYGKKWNNSFHYRCYYDTQQQANQDLSHACLLLAKEQLKDQQDEINKEVSPMDMELVRKVYPL